MKRKPPLVLIAGPTASGKSALALAAARAEPSVVINADSAQVYRDLTILSAAPTAADKAIAEHRLYGVRDGSEPCSAADWAKLARDEIGRAQNQAKVPILVGGTGLYLRTLLHGIAPVPPIHESVRRRVRSQSVEANRSLLLDADPEVAGRLNPGDSARIARALEVVLSTGQSLADWQALRAGGIGADVELRPLVLLPPRAWLYERCDRRFEAMLAGGAVEEVKTLLERDLDPSLPVMRAIGVREIAAFLDSSIDHDEMIARGQQATRNYAKRQYTWFANQPPGDWPRFTQPVDETSMDGALALLEANA